MRIGCLVVACVGLAGAWTSGQERATFSSGADLVVLHVTVTDRRERFVGGLTEESFGVLEDGKPQTLSFFREQDAPVTVGLLIDNSGSMAQNRARVVAAATAFAEQSHPEDEFFAMTFNERVERVMPAGSRFTSDPSVLRSALAAGLGVRGRTALYDAIAAALVDPLVRDGNPKLLRRVADATGGRFFRPSSVQRVDAALRDVSLDIRSSYTLAYVPSNPVRDGRLRRVRLNVVAPDGRRLVARTRMGYVAASERRRDLEARQ